MKGFPGSPERPAWMNTAPCAEIDPELWYPQERDQVTSTTARQICFACRHRAVCLDYALVTNEQDGMWGGKTPEQRRKLRREQRLAAA